MYKKSILVYVLVVFGAFLYIRHQQIDIEIARFDYMMKVMKEEQQDTRE